MLFVCFVPNPMMRIAFSGGSRSAQKVCWRVLGDSLCLLVLHGRVFFLDVCLFVVVLKGSNRNTTNFEGP